jgi:hypothetical protein
MFTEGMLAKALQVVRSVNWDVVEMFAFAFRDLARNFLCLQVVG